MSMSRVAKDMAALRERDPGFLCAYCATPLALPLQQTGSAHLTWEDDGWELYVDTWDEPVWRPIDGCSLAHRDHVAPVSKGGPDHLDNMVLACEVCNIAKGSRPLLYFLAVRAGIPRFRSVGGDHLRVFARGWAA